ncbi:MAG: 16S rRNA (cytosine(1402)-N(4))-methyltransferase, partial [uncultured Gemmatimonadetes bacterium]
DAALCLRLPRARHGARGDGSPGAGAGRAVPGRNAGRRRPRRGAAGARSRGAADRHGPRPGCAARGGGAPGPLRRSLPSRPLELRGRRGRRGGRGRVAGRRAAGPGDFVAPDRRGRARLHLSPRRAAGHADGAVHRRRAQRGRPAERDGRGRAGERLLPLRRRKALAEAGAHRPGDAGARAVRDQRPPAGRHPPYAGPARRGGRQGQDLPGAAHRRQRRDPGAGAGAGKLSPGAGAGRGVRGARLPLAGRPAGEERLPRLEPGLRLPARLRAVPVPRNAAGNDDHPKAHERLGAGNPGQSPRPQRPPARVEGRV